MAKYALTGDWNRLRGFLAEGQELIDGVNEIIEEEAYKLRDEVENEIPFGTPNAPSTIRRKGYNAPLFEDGTLASDEGIVVTTFESRDRDFKKYYMIQGNPNKTVETDDGRSHTIHGKPMTYEELLEVMENGGTGGKENSAVIPPRPVLTVTFDRFKVNLEKEIIAKASSKIHEAIRRT